MSELDPLVRSFQSRLSDVMEAVLQVAVFQVTKLVQDVFLVEVRRRREELEALRTELLQVERRDGDPAGSDGRRDPRDDAWSGWKPGKTGSPEPQDTEEEDLRPDVEEEDLNPPSERRWRSAATDEAGPESQHSNEAAEARSLETDDIAEASLRVDIKADPQISAAYPFPEDEQEAHMTADPARRPSLVLDSAWSVQPTTAAGLLQTHRLEDQADPGQASGSLKQEECEPSPDVQFSSGSDRPSSSGSPAAKLKPSNDDVVAIKEEVLLDCDGLEECGEQAERRRKSGTTSFSCSMNQNRPSSAAHKPNIYREATEEEEATKLEAKVGARFRLRAVGQQLHRPTKKPVHVPSDGPAAAAPAAPVLVANLHHFSRIPFTPKAAPELPVPRLPPGHKQTSPLNRTGASWTGVKSQHQSVHHGSPAYHPEAPPCAGSRHLLRCGQCGKCFPHPSNLKAHLQTHTGERPFCCSLCGRSFTKLSNLKAHRRVHTGERPYCCAACGKRFTQKCNLKRHQRIHLDM